MFEKILEDIVKKNEDALQRLRGLIQGLTIITKDGLPIHTTFDSSTTHSLIKEISTLVQVSRSATRDLDPTDDLKFLRIETDDGEIIVAPENEFTIIILQ